MRGGSAAAVGKAEHGGAGAGFAGGEFEVLLVAVGCGVGCDEVAEECDEGEECDDGHARHGQRVAAEAAPGEAVEGLAGGGEGHGKWKVESGKWKVESGKWKVEN